MMTLKEKKAALVALGLSLTDFNDEYWTDQIELATAHNRWFNKENIIFALEGVRDYMLDSFKLDQWLASYDLNEKVGGKKIGLILAGNLPLVGFHDVLSCFVSDHIAHIKLSEKDSVLIKALLSKLISIEPKAQPYFEFVERLNNMDGVIATGSNNSARYFETYFAKQPHIIRKHRNSIGVLHKDDHMETIVKMGKDIFIHFGLGCRNVSKLLIPRNFPLEMVMEGLHEYNFVNLHDKYKNNFDYNIAVYMLNKVKYLNNGSVMLCQDASLTSRIATLNYEIYEDDADLETKILPFTDQIQCVVSSKPLLFVQTVLPGFAQTPELWDYADNVDTIHFLNQI